MNFALRAPESARVDQVAYARESGLVGLVAGSPFHGKPTLAVVDVESHEVVFHIDSASVGPQAEIVAISPSGKTLVVYSGEGFDKHLELWRFEDEILSKISEISYESFQSPKAHLFSDESGVVLSTKGVLALFEIDERIIPTHHITPGIMGGSSTFGVSDDQNTLFYFHSEHEALYAVDVSSRSVSVEWHQSAREKVWLFVCPNQSRWEDRCPCSGRQESDALQYCDREVVLSHELAKGSLIGNAVQGGLQFLGPDLILINNRSIFDFALGLEIGSVDFEFTRTKSYYAMLLELLARSEEVLLGPAALVR